MIAIFLILLGLIIFSVFVREWDNVDEDVSIHNETVTGIDDVFGYMVDNGKFVRAKFLVEGGSGLDEALEVEKYEG